MSEDVGAVFTIAVEIAGEVGFSFDDPGDHLNDDGVWHYELETREDYGWLMTGPGDEAVETVYPGWGEIEVSPYHLIPFVNEAVAGSLTPTAGEFGGMIGLDCYPDELEDHLIAVYADELDHLGGDASDWRDMIDGDPLEDQEVTAGGE